jgi:hypothetical protein
MGRNTHQPVEEFIERVLPGPAEADVDLDQGLPVFRMPPDAPKLTSADVGRLLNGDEAVVIGRSTFKVLVALLNSTEGGPGPTTPRGVGPYLNTGRSRP